MTLVALIISIAFSYDIESKLEEPYQVLKVDFRVPHKRLDLHADLHSFQLCNDSSGLSPSSSQ